MTEVADMMAKHFPLMTQVRNFSEKQLKKYGVLELNKEYLELFNFLTEPKWVKVDRPLFDKDWNTVTCGHWINEVQTDSHEYDISFTIQHDLTVTAEELLDNGYNFEIAISSFDCSCSLITADFVFQPLLIKPEIFSYVDPESNSLTDPLDTQKRFEKALSIAIGTYEFLLKESAAAEIDFPSEPIHNSKL